MEAYTGEPLKPYLVEEKIYTSPDCFEWEYVGDFDTEEDAEGLLEDFKSEEGIYRLTYSDNWDSLHSPMIVLRVLENV